MRIAFDVKGTLDGQYGKFVLGMLEMMLERGHQVTVWSNSYSYAADFVLKHNLQGVSFKTKVSKWDIDNDETQFYDVAVEDDKTQTYLAAKKFIWVDEFRGLAMGGVKKMVDDLCSEKSA